MQFKSFFFTLALVFVSAVSFANNAPTDVVPVDGEPLTLADINKDIKAHIATLELDGDVKFVKALSILDDEAECTVTVEITVLGQSGTVSATAETCSAALRMVRSTFN